MLTVAQAEALILQRVPRPNADQDREFVDLMAACDRILAQPLTTTVDFPHWDNSAMDGYAVRFADVQVCHPDRPVALQVIAEIPAGAAPQCTVNPGQAARILTGSMMPTGADTVVMQENTRRDGELVFILTPPSGSGAFVRRQGAFYQAGTPLLPAGIRLQAPELAVLAAAQLTPVPVYRRPNVAILSTGSELIPPDRPLQPGQIVDSNQYALTALVAQAGANPLPLGIIPDDPTILEQTIHQAVATADLVISSGGVSVGDYDYVEAILAKLGAEIAVRSVAMRPGKPLTVATLKSPTRSTPVLYFGLPGNPVSALVTFWRFVQPALLKRAGLARSWGPVFTQALTTQELRGDSKRETYLWGQIHATEQGYRFHPVEGGHNSGNLINLAQTNALAVLATGQQVHPANSPVQVMVVGQPLTGGNYL
ncbi:molybdopterin molybdenumtransferase [Leptolyngbya sp. 'hensonii']|nr:gephyrin-like molybdotransferase Glp [Leptolyngbya sp. 'hensonii']OLP19274.1 molybdopterin molybdenumtransferase [Leptolyngbya sp. 'hensonii']